MGQPPQQYPYPQPQPQKPWEPGLPPKQRWSRRKKWTIISAIVAAFLIIGTVNAIISGGRGILNQEQPTPTYNVAQQANQPTGGIKLTAKPTQIISLSEHLTFSGDISGVLTQGDNPGPLTHDNPIPNYIQQPDGSFFDPAPTLTQCSDFDSGVGQDYVAVIVGKVGTMRYAVTVEINEDNPAYTNPGTALRPGNTNMGGSVTVYEIGGKNRRWQQVYGPALQDTVIVMHTDKVSGTVDAWMASTDLSQKEASSTLHVQGNWRCG